MADLFFLHMGETAEPRIEADETLKRGSIKENWFYYALGACLIMATFIILTSHGISSVDIGKIMGGYAALIFVAFFGYSRS